MCLKLNNGIQEFIAEEDIICYKHLVKKEGGRGKVTTYRNFPIVMGRVYESDIRIFHSDSDSCYEINIALHSFKEIRNCVSDCRSEEYAPNVLRSYIVECIIPKGSKYYKGTFCGWEGYASNKLKYGKVLKSKTIRTPSVTVLKK